MTYITILATLAAYRLALPLANRMPDGRMRDVIVTILGGGGPGNPEK